ncbi:MAG: rRNA maturation RNase YbeY [Jatrophihabitans sp.]
MTIEVNNESGATVDEVTLARLARFDLDRLGVSPLAELSVLLVDAEAMSQLHEQWMDLPGPTDVMAFPMDALPEAAGPGIPPGTRPQPLPTLLGDVVLCPSVAEQQAATAGHSTEAELFLLLTHGVLHLLGYDHATADEEREMFELQADLLTGWTEQSGGPTIRTPVAGTEGKVRK